MKRASPLAQMTMAIVALCGMLVVLGQLFFDAVPDRARQQREIRKTVGESMAVQVALLLQQGDPQTAKMALANIASRMPDVRSIGVRRSDGQLLLQTGNHEAAWRPQAGDGSTDEQLAVPLSAGGTRWGRVEIAFVADGTHPVLRWLTEPFTLMLLFISAGGTLVFWLYMRRVLQHLDPSAVVPERVQGAFDVMAEGVAVLDLQGRVMLTNRAFRNLHPDAGEVRPGTGLGALPWLAEGLPTDPARHPWSRAIDERRPNAGTAIVVGADGGDERHLVVNAAPITDVGGAVRGCLTTFSDVSALHQAHAALQEAMSGLEASKREVEAKNVELERLATRDPLTGCLNRRAFHAAFDRLFVEARESGQPLSCLMVDIDHFKSINDTHGHGVGDRVIQETARRLMERARATDLVCRYGGEEFCVVVPGLDARETMALAERLRVAIEKDAGVAVREVDGLRLTASIGIDVLSADAPTPKALLDRADQALYRAKRGGRNRVESFAPYQLAPAAPAIPDAPSLAAGVSELLDRCRADGRSLAGIALAPDIALAGRLATPAESLPPLMSSLWRVMREGAPADAIMGRLDPYSLCLVAPGLDIEGAAVLARTLAERAREVLHLALPGTAEGSVTVSAGVDALLPTAPGAATLPDRARAALKRARRAAATGEVNRFVGGSRPDAEADAAARRTAEEAGP